VVPKAEIVAKQVQAQASFKTTANDAGGWSIPYLPIGTYTITIGGQGFKVSILQNVKVDAATTTTVHAVLEVGGAEEQVFINRGGSRIQSEASTISTTMVGRQIGELPWATRDALQLVLTVPGVQTPGTPRTSSVNGLPKSALSITLDGANIQDNFFKSGDGFFTLTQAKSDAVEEVSVSTATLGAESSGDGAIQIRFITRAGSNFFHGGLFWQHRNTALNANYYFNNIDGLPRDVLILNQSGGHLGGPLVIPRLFKDGKQAFFFVNYEEFQLPQTYTASRTVLTDSARQGFYTYKEASGQLRSVNLYQLAAAGGFLGTADPTILPALNLIHDAAQKGILNSRTETLSDYNRLDLVFQDPGRNLRRFPTVRLDFNLTKNHRLEFIHHYQHYFSVPDAVNGILAAYPGMGSVVGNSGERGSIYRNAFSFVMAERWTISNRLVNEVRFTSSGNGTATFRREFNAGNFAFWDGYAVINPFTSSFATFNSQSRRNTPVKTLSDNLNWIKNAHSLNFGGIFTRITAFNQSDNTQTVPTISLGIAPLDPVATGNSNIFNTGNFPGSTPAQRTEAANLYALLTGRVSATNKIAVLEEKERKFSFLPYTERNHQVQWGFYLQDAWKVKPNLTLNLGLRWEFQPSPINDNLVYTRTGFAGLYGVSGPGNLFKPGVFEGSLTQYRLVEQGERAYKNRYQDFAPSLGFAWTPRLGSGLRSRIFGKDAQTVLRGGYSIAFVREGFQAFTSMFGMNEGPFIVLGTDPSTFLPEFGPPGSVLYRDRIGDRAAIPFRPLPEPRFPFTARAGASLNDFNPNLKAGYVQSYSFGLQRELDKNTALEIRYVGNHATHLWRQHDLNEVNIFENGFLAEFRIAQQNLALSRAAGRGENYGNQGLPGQLPIPIIQTAIGSLTDLTTLTAIRRGEAGRLANNISANLPRMNRLITAGLVPFVSVCDPNDISCNANNPERQIRLSNFFIANPRSPGNAFLMDSGAGETYNSLQVELRRRMSGGVLLQGSYVFAKSLTNTFASSRFAFSQPTTLRNLEYDKGASPFDIRHAFKLNWIHELPVGPGRRFLNLGTPIIRKLLEGWQWAGVMRIQSGTPNLLTGGRLTFNNRESGVALHNLNTRQLQSLVKIRKETVCDSGGKCQGVIFWLPRSLINNSLAAFEVGGKTLADLDPSLPYIGPPTEPGKLGARIFLYGPWQARFDFNLMKRTSLTERVNFEFRVQFLSAFNTMNFSIQDPDIDVGTVSLASPAFGQTRRAYRDVTVSGTNDPGGRLIEFQVRLNF
jgi:outer membrane receptor protein involved in Fe transport